MLQERVTGVRGALFAVAGAQYLGMAVQFGLLVGISRLLTPEEIGVSVVSAGIVAIAYSLREFATCDFLVLRREVSREDIRTAFTLSMGLSGLIATAILGLAPLIAQLYGQPGVSRFLSVIAAAGLLEAISLPLMALLRRGIAFGRVSFINVTSVTVSAAVTLALAALGLGYMSFAWAGLCAAATTTLLAVYFFPYWWMFRPALSSARSALLFGGYNGTTVLLQKLHEALPQLVVGRLLPVSAVGFYNRAIVICGIPDKFLLSPVFSVAFPAFAVRSRETHSIKQPYLTALSYITVVQWPAQISFALLAHPIVVFLVGHQWIGVAPLVQILCLSAIFWFPVALTYQALIALGALRQNLILSLVSRSLATVVLCAASVFGLTVLAASQFVVAPLQMVMALYFIRAYVCFQWRELAAALWKSAVVTLCTIIGSVLVIGLANFRFDLPLGAAFAAAILSGSCWLVGLWLTRHPLLSEIENVLTPFRTSAFGLRLLRLPLRLGRSGTAQRTNERLAPSPTRREDSVDRGIAD